jgi:hypothetical protein
MAGMAIGALTGWLASLLSKRNPKAVWRNAFLPVHIYALAHKYRH